MNINEIKDKEWKISKDVAIVKSDMKCFEAEEQETHFNVLRFDSKLNKASINVCSSYLKFTGKLSRSKKFTLERVLISDSNEAKGRILEVQGTLDVKGLTIRR